MWLGNPIFAIVFHNWEWMAHTVKCFTIIYKAQIERMSVFSAFLYYVSYVDYLFSCPSAFTEPCLLIWDLGLQFDFHSSANHLQKYFACMTNQADRSMIRTFFQISLLWQWYKNSSTPVLRPLPTIPDIATETPHQVYTFFTSPVAFHISEVKLSKPGDLPFFSCFIASSTSDVSGGGSISSLSSHWVSTSCSCAANSLVLYCTHLSLMSSFSVSVLPFSSLITSSLGILFFVISFTIANAALELFLWRSVGLHTSLRCNSFCPPSHYL